MKQFLRYILTIVAILIATTNAWAAATCHTVTKSTFTTDASYTKKSWGITYTYYYFSPSDQSSFTISNDLNTISQISFKATGDTKDGDLKFKVIYKTTNNSSWQEVGNEVTLARTGFIVYDPGEQTITLNTSNYPNLKNATEIGLRFTKYHNNTEGFQSNKRTITISDVSVTFSNYFHSNANGTTLDFGSIEKDQTSEPKTFTYQYNNKITSVNWVSDNDMFSVSAPSHTEDCSGEQEVSITYTPTEIRDEITGTITGTANTGQVITIYVKGSSWSSAAEDPTYTWNTEIWNGSAQNRDIYVDETINNLLTYTSSSATCTYSIEHLGDNGTTNNGDAITTFAGNTLVAGRAGTYRLTVTQSEATGYNAGTTSIELTIKKHQTAFYLDLKDEYLVDEIDNNLFSSTTDLSGRTINVSDSKNYFTYSNGELQANCPTQLPANSDPTTITVTQPENYKWTSYSLNKTVTVKKHTTEFAWQLQDSYFVGEEDASIFTKSDNNLASTITSSDPSVIEVVDNKLVMRKAGSAVITVSQATDRKWTAFTETKTVNVVKRDLTATIRQSSAVWNELISNPFTVSFTHPITGAVTTLTDYSVTQTDESKQIAEYKSNDIQTYYTNGTVSFQITRPEDDNYNALNLPLTLKVNADAGICYVLEDLDERSWSTISNSGTYTIPSGIPDVLIFQAKRTAIAGFSNTSNFYAEYSTDNSNWTDAMTISLSEKDTWYDLQCDIPDNAKYIRFKTETGATGNKQIRNVYVTRKTYLTTTPAVEESDVLTLPPVAINQPSSNTFTLNWSTCSDIKIACDNSKFTISDNNGTPITDITTDDGTIELKVSCNTSETSTFTGNITIYNQAEKVTIPVSCTVNPRWIPEFTGSTTYSKSVDDTWVADFKFKNTETTLPSADTNAPFHFSIKHDLGENTILKEGHNDEVISYDPETYTITAHNAGTAILTFTQKDTPGYYPGSYSCTITVVKHETSFELNLANAYFVDDEVATTNILKNKTNNEVDIQVTEVTNNNRHLFTYNGTRLKADGDQLQADSETTTITVTQPETYKWTGKTLNKSITVKKYDSQFAFTNEGAKYVCEIDNVITEAQFYSLANNEIPANVQVEITEVIDNEHPEVLIFNQDTRQWEAKSAGTAIVTISQPEDRKWTAYSGTRIVEVKKNTPTFKWHGQPVTTSTDEYFNETYTDYFTTTNTSTPITITQQTDTNVAELYFVEGDTHTLDLTTYYKETNPASSTQVTVSQTENWKWYAHEETKTITPKNKNNHVEFILTEENYIRDFRHSFVDPAADDQSKGPDWKNGGIYFGGEGAFDENEGWNWNEKYFIIQFEGIPDTLTFDASRAGAATGTIELSVWEGTKSDNLTKIWSNSDQSEHTNIQYKLNPETRFLKFSYTGNLWGLFKNVHVTEFNQFEASPTALNFGTVTLDDNPSKALNFNLHYANAGYNVTLDLDRTGGWATEEAYNLAKQYIRIEPATITTIGGEKHGTVENIRVTLHSDDQAGYTIPANARLKISDEAGHTTYVNLSGKIEKSTQTITWNDYFSLQEPIQIPISTDSVRGAAKASSNLPVKYRSADDAVIKVNDNGLCFIPAGVGTTTITAYQEGNNQYAYVESTKQVQVTGKSIQLINWTDDLSDLIFYQDTEDPDSIALTAQVYIIDVVNSTFEFSQEQTDKLVYTIAEGGESIIKITNDTLTMLGIGETTITVTIEADEQHEGATMTIPVIVREPAMGCEDKILITPPSQIEFFQMNTDEISKDAIAINRAEGVPGFLLFSHIGKQWTILGMNFYTGTIKAQQSTDGGNTWQDVAGSEITPTLNKEQQTDSILLDRNATHIRFVRPAGGQGYHYVTNIKVVPVQYVEVEQNTIDFENINMGGVYQKTFTISYSNIKSPLIATTSSKDVTVEPNRWGECGDFGSKEFTVTWKPNNNQNQSITIQDTLADLSVTINLQANIQLRKQKIVWENRPTVILDHTGIDNRPLYTRDANNNELLDLPITYEVTNGSDLAYFENGMFFIINTGEITIKASNPGNNEYLAVDSTYQLIIQGIPPTFIGSTEAGADSLWTNQNNWVNGLMPTKDNTANIVAPVQVNTAINVQGVRVAESGSIHITSTGGLTIGEGGIQTVTTDGSAIVIDNLHSGAGFFRINPNCEDELPRITMRYQTKSTLDSGANKDATWQYIGAPGEDASVHVDYNTWLYCLDESQADWVLMPQNNNHTLDPFQGYALTQYGQPTYEWNAQMINRNCTIPLTYHFDGRKGQNLIANSYTAPIDVTQMTSKDFQMIDGQSEYYDITQTLYLYNSGSWNAWHTQDSLGTGISSDGDNTTPGQYYAIPVLAVAKGYIPEKPTIAPMQGIYVRVRAKKTGGNTHVGNIIFNYDRIVMGEGHDMHRPMRAPKKSDITSIPSENFRRLRIVATSEHSGADRLYIIQDDINTRNYDNGYDAPNQATQGIVNIYTYESGGKMEVSCANNIDSTYIGFMAGEDRIYTLHFNTIVGETLCLQDLTNGEKINIVEGGTYTFEAEPQSTNNQRFLLLAPQGIKSDIDEIDSVNIWYSNRTLYITNAADNSTLQLYDVSGHQIFSTTIHRTPYTIDLTHLTEGVYMARVNNQVYKFVCK